MIRILILTNLRKEYIVLQPASCSMLNYSAKLCANSVAPSFCKAGFEKHARELSMELQSPFNLVKVYLE